MSLRVRTNDTPNPVPVAEDLVTYASCFVLQERDGVTGHARVAVERRGTDAWTVTVDGWCATKGGSLVYEPMPSSRSLHFQRRTRWSDSDFDQAWAMGWRWVHHLERLRRKRQEAAREASK